jgi:hypothetical protein
MNPQRKELVFSFVALAAVVVNPLSWARGDEPSLRKALSLHATFDNGTEADHARGDRVLYTASSMKRDDAKPGLPDGVVLAEGKGRHGDALRFAKKTGAVVFYRAAKNVAYAPKDWSGTVSFWLSLDPEKDLEPGYTDPLQMTERGWNDGALWVDFSDKSPRHLRLGAFADLKVWNPENRDFEKMSPEERPMFDAGRPPFAAGKWSHVAFTFEHFNTGMDDGVATLYLDGQRRGSVRGRTQTFTWDPEKSAVMLGLSFTGFFDELAIFDRALTDAEIVALHRSGGRIDTTKR